MKPPEQPRRTGRPDRQESAAIVQRIIDTATRLFKAQGYAATSIEQIAGASGSGKQTIYRRFKTKEKLFQVVMQAHSESVRKRVWKEAHGEDPLQALKNINREMLGLMLSPESLSFQRVLIAEAVRFPEFVSRIFDNNVGSLQVVSKRLLKAAIANGQLRRADPDWTFHFMTGMLTGWVHQEALRGRNVLPTPALRKKYFEAGWKLFLAGAGA
jgi:TetR/AcrR family transcriptional regulator of autoinduction and epiphytic fitness